MPGNPRECRQHALNCQKLADSAATPSERETLLTLSATWTRLASELESAQALLDAINDVNGVAVRRPEAPKKLNKKWPPRHGKRDGLGKAIKVAEEA